MLVVLMTHGDRRKSVSRSVFGGLSELGRWAIKRHFPPLSRNPSRL
jgi:hypothetical protein